MTREQFLSQYTGEWSPSDGHWFGLDFGWRGQEYRFQTDSMYHPANTVLPDGREARFGVYKKEGSAYALIGEYATPQEALALARRYGAEIQYDETAQSPWFRYTAETGTVHEVWFEDARSSLAKLRLAADNGLQGVGLWNLMRDAPQTYLVLNGAFQVEKLA